MSRIFHLQTRYDIERRKLHVFKYSKDSYQLLFSVRSFCFFMFLKSPVNTIRQIKIIAKASEISRNEINPSKNGVPSLPPAIGINFPAPVIAANVTATKFRKNHTKSAKMRLIAIYYLKKVYTI